MKRENQAPNKTRLLLMFLYPKRWPAFWYFLRGMWNLTSGKPANAIPNFNRALQIWPNQPFAPFCYKYLGIAYVDSEQSNLAGAYSKMSCKERASSEESSSFHAAIEKLGGLELGKQYLSKASEFLAEADKDSELYSRLGWTHFLKEDYQTAQRYFQLAVNKYRRGDFTNIESIKRCLEKIGNR